MDETLPLLPDEHVDRPIDDSGKDTNIVDFDPKGDPENPRDWPHAYKWSIVALLAFTSFTVTFTCISVVPIASRIVADLEQDKSGNKKSSSVLLVTIWELGEAAGPLLIAPFSEMFGRYPIINVCNVLFISATVIAALSQSTSLFIFARALNGLAVATNVLNPAIIGDLFIPEQRGTAMSLTVLAPIIGGAIGPAIAGAIAETLGWRYVLWMSLVLSGLAEVLFLTLFRETYTVPILQRKAARLRKETGNQELHSALDEDDSTPLNKFWISIARPAVVVFNSGVLQALSFFGAILFTYFYILSTSLPDILQIRYGLTPAQTGSAFIFFSIGSAPSIIILNRTLDRVYIWLRDSRHKGIGQPEYRLPFTILGGLLIPLVVLGFGWVSEKILPLPILLISVSLLGSVLMLGMLPIFSYVVDAFHLYSASALTAVIVIRCLTGTFLPLLTQPLVDRVGYGWAFTIFAAISLAVAPIPIYVYRYGGKLRQRSAYTRDT